MKGVYKKYLNNVTGTIIFLQDETVGSLGEVADSLLKRVDEALYFYADGKYTEIPTPRRVNVEVVEVKAGAPEEEVKEEVGIDMVETEAKVKTSNKNKKKNEG